MPVGKATVCELGVAAGGGVAVAWLWEPEEGAAPATPCGAAGGGIWAGGLTLGVGAGGVGVDGSIVANPETGSIEEQAAWNRDKAPAERPNTAARRMNSRRFRDDPR